MKTILKKALHKGSILFFCLFGYVVNAQVCYNECGEIVDCSTPGSSPIPPPTPCDNLPISENIFILLFIALLFGLYVISKYQQNKKTAT